MWTRPGQGKCWLTATADLLVAFLIASITTSHLCWLTHGASGHGYPEVRHLHWAIPSLAAIPRDQRTDALQWWWGCWSWLCFAEQTPSTLPCCPYSETRLLLSLLSWLSSGLINPGSGMNLVSSWGFLTTLLFPIGTWCHLRVLLPSWANEDLSCSSCLW